MPPTKRSLGKRVRTNRALAEIKECVADLGAKFDDAPCKRWYYIHDVAKDKWPILRAMLVKHDKIFHWESTADHMDETDQGTCSARFLHL